MCEHSETGPSSGHYTWERRWELLPSFSLEGRQRNKHCKHELWQPFKTWKWKLGHYLKHTCIYEHHTVLMVPLQPVPCQGNPAHSGWVTHKQAFHVPFGDQTTSFWWNLNEMYSRTSKDEVWMSLMLPSKRLAGTITRVIWGLVTWLV